MSVRQFTTVALRAPFSARAARELLFCLAGILAGILVLALPFAAAGLAYLTTAGDRAAAAGGVHQPAVSPAALLSVLVALAAVVVLATPVGRALATVHRALAARLLGARIPALAAVPAARGLPGRLRAVLSNGPGWRAIAYSLLKLPLAVLEGYGVFCWIAGLANLTYPFWWRLFRNHPPEVHLRPVPVLTPFGLFEVTTFAGTFAAFAAGAAMLLSAPWLARGTSQLDLWIMRGLLGPGRLAQRVEQLRVSRARAVDDAAEMIRRLERDLHDGAQIRLATLAMNLGMAREKLGDDGPPPDLAQARDLIAGAHLGAKEALTELRDLVRGIHPPVLDNGLPDALATLASASAIPVALSTRLPTRPAPAIETIAYFCIAELLANAAKHSRATAIAVDLAAGDGTLLITVGDNGSGGADPVRGTGLAGLVQRISTVDGTMRVTSPPGGPTRITVDLPLHA